jgi:hypothetical protein
MISSFPIYDARTVPRSAGIGERSSIAQIRVFPKLSDAQIARIQPRSVHRALGET